MRRAASLLTLGLLLVAFTAAAKPDKPLLPTLHVSTDDGQHALELVAIRIDATIRGHLARTEVELTYRNDLHRVVEGDFHFPLPADAELTGLGLWFNGRLRRAVAVERERARVAYETTIHQRIDPALVEWSGGRGADLRVYPIPARGEKKVWLSYDQELLHGDYVLDLRYGRRFRSIEIRIDADGRFVRDRFALSHQRPYTIELFDEVLDRMLIVEADQRTEVLAARDDAARRWYLAAAPRPAGSNTPVPPAEEVIVFWDSSGSASRQNRAALDAFLDRFLEQQASARVSLIPFDLRIGAPIDVTQRAERIRALDAMHAIGATNYPALFARMRELMANAAPATRFVLVTDGLTSLGGRREIAGAADALRALSRPLTVINSAPQADDILLARIALATNGWLIDLGATTPDVAVEAAMRAPSPATITSAALPLAVAATAASHSARIAIAGDVEFKPAVVPLRIGAEERTLVVRELRQPREIAMVRSAYARAALRQLLLSMASDAEILEHGRRFQQLTPRTSLLVLESWRDYERWGIAMPEDVRREMETEEREDVRMAARGEDTRPPVIERAPQPPLRDAGPWILNGVTTLTGAPLPGATVRMTVGNVTHTTVTDIDGRFRFELPHPPSQFSLRAELDGLRTLNNHVGAVPTGSTVRMEMAISAVSESITVTAEAPAVLETVAVATAFVNGPAGEPSAEAQALAARLFGGSDAIVAGEEMLAAFATRRRATLDAVAAAMGTIASVDERIRYYVTARNVLGGDKTFHLQAALLFQKDAPAVASRMLSDLAEAYPDDSALLRILARIFEGWNEHEIARLLLRHALDVAASESQTWRELLLVEARLGNSRAIDEIETMAAAADATVRDEILRAIEPVITRWRALPPSTPHDLRFEDNAEIQVDLMWDLNFSDIDLYVTEPGGETVMYKHLRSAQGGQLHEDITTGYGPEIYTIAQPRAGTYEIAIDYFSVDDTEIGIETLAHLVVYERGAERQDFILLLSAGKEHRVVAKVER